jgi:hypothetical protein
MKLNYILTILATLSLTAFAATPAQEKEFVDNYKKALEANDAKALAGFLHTDGAAKDTVEFFTMMQTINAGKKVSSIELVTPSAADMAKLNEPMEMPDGKKYKMPFPRPSNSLSSLKRKAAKALARAPAKARWEK